MQLEVLLVEKDENLKPITIELERTQKKLRLLNNDTSKLDHLITTGELFGDHSGVDHKGESSGVKTMFIKSGFLADCVDVSYNKPIVQSVATEASLL